MKNMALIEQQLKFDNIDFATVRLNLCLPNAEGGFEWELEEADEAIEAYVQFLKNVAENIPNRQLSGDIYHAESKILFEQAVPEAVRQMVAIVWERHVLNTRQYTEDCLRIFKTYLHYSPSLFNDRFSLIIQ